MEKKLYRSRIDKKICGVCGGLAAYIDMDVSILRIIWAIAAVCAGSGVLAYLICALVIPEEPDYVDATVADEPTETADAE